MSGGGGKTTTVQQASIPDWAVPYAKENLAKGSHVSEIGYTPNYGLDVAAFSPMQSMAMQNTANTAAAFGMAPQGFNAMGYMPLPEQANGFSGYRSGNLYDESVGQLAMRAPAQYAYQQSMFVDPQTGIVPIQFSGGQPSMAQDYVSSPNLGFGGSGGGNPYMTYGDAMASMPSWSPDTNYGMITQDSLLGKLSNLSLAAKGLGTINNAVQLGQLQTSLGIQPTSFLDRLQMGWNLDRTDNLGSIDVNGNNYNVSLGGIDANARTTLTPTEARNRIGLANTTIGQEVAAREAAIEAARAAGLTNTWGMSLDEINAATQAAIAAKQAAEIAARNYAYGYSNYGWGGGLESGDGGGFGGMDSGVGTHGAGSDAGHAGSDNDSQGGHGGDGANDF